MIARLTRRSALGLGTALVAAAAVAVGIVASALQGGSPFPRLVPRAAPAAWQHVMLPNGTAVLSYPPSLHRVHSDRDAASAARLSPAGAYLIYLNATPRQGKETLRNWASFRVKLLREDDASAAHLVSAAQRIRFRGGTGSCVIDDYVTRIGTHHYEEIACLAQGRTGASVVVAAAAAEQWAKARPLLEQAIAAYTLR
jgi:hypothetical protein